MVHRLLFFVFFLFSPSGGVVLVRLIYVIYEGREENAICGNEELRKEEIRSIAVLICRH